MKYNAISLALLTSLTLPAGVANANAVPDDEDIEKLTVSGERLNNYLYEKADSLSRLDLDIKDLPQSISVIGEEMIDDFALNNINAVLDTVTGLNVEEVETDRTYFTARGFDVTNFQVDGLGLPVLSGNVHGDIDTAIYDRVEVLRGANGLMTGTGSPSATINYVRKKPTENTQISARGQLGSWNAKRLDIDASAPLTDSVGARVVVVKENRESYLDRYELDKTVAYGVISAALTDTTQLTVGASQQTSDAKGNMWGALTLYYADGTPTNFDTSTSTSADWSQWDVTDTRYFVFLEQQLAEGWSLKADYTHIETDEDTQLFYTYVSRDADTGVTLLDPETGLGLIGYGSEYTLDDEHDYADIYLNGNFDAFGQTHQVMMGASYAKVAYTDQSLYDFHTGNGFPLLPAMEDWTGNTPLPEFTDTRAQMEAAFRYSLEKGVVGEQNVLVLRPDQVRGAIYLSKLMDTSKTKEDLTTVSFMIPGTRDQSIVSETAGKLRPLLSKLESHPSIDHAGLTGSPFTREEQLSASTRTLYTSLPVAIAAATILLLVTMRSLKYAVVTVIPIGLVVAWLYGIMSVAGFALNFVTAMIGAISIGVGIDYSIHMTERFREELGRNVCRIQALTRAARGTGVALVASAASSVVGFTIMGFAPMPMFASYGQLTAVMITLALLASLIVLPSLLMLVTREPESVSENVVN